MRLGEGLESGVRVNLCEGLWCMYASSLKPKLYCDPVCFSASPHIILRPHSQIHINPHPPFTLLPGPSLTYPSQTHAHEQAHVPQHNHHQQRQQDQNSTRRYKTPPPVLLLQHLTLILIFGVDQKLFELGQTPRSPHLRLLSGGGGRLKDAFPTQSTHQLVQVMLLLI